MLDRFWRSQGVILALLHSGEGGVAVFTVEQMLNDYVTVEEGAVLHGVAEAIDGLALGDTSHENLANVKAEIWGHNTWYEN